MTHYERMLAGKVYDSDNDEIHKDQDPMLEKLYDFNQTRPSELPRRREMLKDMFAEIGEGCYIEPPLRANWGGAHVHFGNRVYANFNLTLVDDGHIYVDDCVMFGPNVTIVIAGHPVETTLRSKAWQFNRDVHIGKNVWFGAGVVVLPGVTIGENTVIGAGSIVTKDIPANVVAVGNPCRVMREISDRDKEFFYKNDSFDWDEIEELLKSE
jgi:galactoside O-acetyltransferase